MSATYSNGTITQTGTDTDPTVFSGLTGVTITGTSEYRVVLFDGVELIVNGILSIPKYYRLYFINTATVDFKINGTINVDYFTTTTEGTVYHTTPWVEFGRQSTSSAGQQCLEVSGSGTLNWRGGSILADPVIRLSAGSTVLFNNSVIDSTQTNMFRIYTSNLTFEGPLINIGKRTTINASGITLDNYSPKGGNGLDHGATNTSFVLNNFNPEANTRDSVLRFDNGDSIFNASTGMHLKVAPLSPNYNSHNGGACRLYRKISTNIKDINNNALQGVKTFIPSYNDGNRVNLSYFSSGGDFTAVSDTTLTTAANGKSSIHNQILKVWYLLTTTGSDSEVIRFDKNADDGGIFTVSSYKYGYLVQTNDYTLNGLNDLEINKTFLPDANITESSKVAVDAYTEINTSFKLYDRAASYLEANFGTYLDFIITRSGNEINASAFNVTIDATAAQAFVISGNAITIKASTFTGNIVTTGTISLVNGATFVGTRTDTNGTVTVTELTLTGLQANTEVRIYQAGTTTEIDGVENSGTTFSTTTSRSSVDIVIHALGYEYQRLNSVDTSQNLTLPISQRFDRNYNNP